MQEVIIIGGGLAGCEAAWAAAERGKKVTLYEMKPQKFSPAHSMQGLCELVCSNSLKALRVESAGGLLKKEMEHFGSVTVESAYQAQVPAGGALAVDREKFSKIVTEKIMSHKNIEVVREEVTKIPEDKTVIIACGPLVEGELCKEIERITGGYLSFFDAAAPIVSLDSIDMESAFFGARYGRGGDDYINCPLTREEYETFYAELIGAERAPLHEEVDKPKVFEGCMPVEIMAGRGADTLRFGPLKPVGIRDPRYPDVRPYAVVQLRQDNAEGTLYNMVGFQTNLKFGEQKRVFSLIPALKNAEFVRYGVMHRNLFINSPELLNADFSMKNNKNIYFAGQISGVEGYMESAMSGIIAGMSASGNAPHLSPLTMMGAISNYISGGSVGTFQPMNANFGILPPLDIRIKNKQQRYGEMAKRSLETLYSDNA